MCPQVLAFIPRATQLDEHIQQCPAEAVNLPPTLLVEAPAPTLKEVPLAFEWGAPDACLQQAFPPTTMRQQQLKLFEAMPKWLEELESIVQFSIHVVHEMQCSRHWDGTWKKAGPAPPRLDLRLSFFSVTQGLCQHPARQQPLHVLGLVGSDACLCAKIGCDTDH